MHAKAQIHTQRENKWALTSMSICSFIKHKHSIFYLKENREENISNAKCTEIHTKKTCNNTGPIKFSSINVILILLT